ncbi:Riboflavin biosynthesis protein RibD [Paraurantiacibacter namhicola]|uniref:Riboflavin biosynthesis protein RibD n=1 Tax=Paraurantiacibacter namhicola TaxID=645517 RepID=A0A1C7D749_9SPHN|nr:Riboflavin biosynthesis protein RibD [Paraurantiacibacter namhicola]
MANKTDLKWLDMAARLAERGRPSSSPNPAVACVIVKDGIVLGRGVTQAGGRPHAEALALAEAGRAAEGADVFTTLEPCAHVSERGPTCSHSLAEAGVARVIIGCHDPDPRTAGSGIAALRAAGVEAQLVGHLPSAESLAGYLARAMLGRPHITLKLALSLDGCIALADGTSQWITGPEARAHAHRERARADGILVGGETLRADSPSLDVRLPGLEDRSSQRLVLTRGDVPDGWRALSSPQGVAELGDCQYLFIEGGAGAAAAFLAADLVDRLLIYRAPIVLGGGRPGVADIGLAELSAAHDRWQRSDTRSLGSDTLEVYQRIRS